MIANLGMYDMPATRAANDRLWSRVRASLGYGPTRLTRADTLWPIWQSPDLLLAQTCGYPYRARLHGHVQLLATPDYGLPDCPEGQYFSYLIARASDPRRDIHAFDRPRFAYNEALSQSGWAAPVLFLTDAGVTLSDVVQTGAHVLSARAVATGRADLAGIDALTWALLVAHMPDLTDQLAIVARTPPTPALPFITALGRDADAIRAALAEAIDTASPEDRATLHLRGLCRIAPAAYLALQSPPDPQWLLSSRQMH